MTPFLKNNIQIYFILVNLLIFLIYSLTILLIIMTYRIKNKKLNILWPISILKFCLPFFSVGFFGQSFLLLTTIFDCQNGYAYVSKELICRTGVWFTIDAPLSAIAMILQALIAIITNSLYYKSTFVKNGSDVLKKTNCYPDIILLYTKIGIIVLFILDDGVEEEHWAVLFFLILFTGINSFFAFFYQNRVNKNLNFLNKILSLMPFIGFCSLLIGKIFKFLGFNGSIFLFFSWIIFCFIFILLYKRKDIDFALINYNEIENSGDYLNYLNQFFNLIINKNNSRNDSTILKSIISKIEEKCMNSYCPLKKYMENLTNDDNIFPLLQYLENLFEYGISKFPNDIQLKINYSFFLIMEMNRSRKALINLNSINSSIYSFQDNYNIYRCKRLIDLYLINRNKNIINSFEYKKMIKDFKNLITKVTSLYNEFWSLIIINKINVMNNIEELGRLGSEIPKLNNKIQENFDKLIKIKYSNYELIRLYTNFIKYVLNDNEKYNIWKNKESNLIYNTASDSDEIQFSNFKINELKDKDIFKYLILSANIKDLAKIMDFSTNLCPIFGYNKDELIGKNINFLIPELFHKVHNKILVNFNENAREKFLNELYDKVEYIPEYIEKNVYGISKTKFLLPLKIKVYFVQTEESDIAYIVEVKKIKDFNYDLENNEDNNLKCIVLTDDNFYIHSFTPNCVNCLIVYLMIDLLIKSISFILKTKY